MNISCIIPTKNRCTMVLEAIASIMLQDYDGELEILVVDDGSTDSTADVIRSRFPQVGLVRQDNAGPGAARNAGVAATGGDVLMFLDSDDLWMEDHVRRLVDVLERGFQVAYGVTQNIDEIRDSLFLIPDLDDLREGDCFDLLAKWCFLVPSSVAVSREAFLAVNGFDPVDCGEDWLFFLRLAARYPFGCAGPGHITLRRLHRGSLCFFNNPEKLLAMTGRVINLLEHEPRATAVQRNRLTRVHEWTATNPVPCSTVQDWYLAMLGEKII